jgi:hypothetical protein
VSDQPDGMPALGGEESTGEVIGHAERRSVAAGVLVARRADMEPTGSSARVEPLKGLGRIESAGYRCE